MAVGKYIKMLFFPEILKGLFLTFKSMVGGSVTRQYPEEKRESQPGFRGLHALVRDKETGKEKCIACGLCAAMCPSQCISLTTGEDEGHQKVVERYEVDTLRCLFCGLCVEACPIGAVALTEHYEYASYKRADFLMTKQRLLENWDNYMAGEKGERYFKYFWHPNLDDYSEYEGQPSGKAVKK